MQIAADERTKWPDAERVKVEALIAQASETVRNKEELERQVTFYKRSLASPYNGAVRCSIHQSVLLTCWVKTE